MNPFVVGDRVRLIDTPGRDPDGPLPGSTGTVVDANRNIPIVSWDGFNYKHADRADNPSWVAVYANEVDVMP